MANAYFTSQTKRFLMGLSALSLLVACQIPLAPLQNSNSNPPLSTQSRPIRPPQGRLHCPPGRANCRPQAFNLPNQDQFILPPEYKPTQAVMISDRLMADMSGRPLVQALIQANAHVWMLGTDQTLYNQTKQIIQSTLSPLGLPLAAQIYQLPVATDSIWSRDYGPLTTLPTAAYTGPKLDYKLMNSFYYPDRRSDDRVPALLSRILNSPLGPLTEKTVFTSQLSLALEGGNLMCTEQDCFSSQSVIDRNLGQSFRNGRTLNTEEDIKAEFKSQIQQTTHFVPALPTESTGHIDMWAKFLNQNTLLIGQLSDQSIQLAPAEYQAQLKDIQAFLEMQASGKDSNGQVVPESLYQQALASNAQLKVVRIPMPLPLQEYQGASLFRSYTNALIVNNHALIPQYRSLPNNQAYPDNALLQGYEQAVSQAYQAAGYQVKWIPSDTWIVSGGAVHCVTMQIPQV